MSCNGQPLTVLASGIGATDLALNLSVAAAPAVGSYLQVEEEVLRVEEVLIEWDATPSYPWCTRNYAMRITATSSIDLSSPETEPRLRRSRETFSEALTAGAGLTRSRCRMSEWRAPSCSSLTQSETVRSAASILPTMTIKGLRTLSGGQYSIQVDGYLAVDQSAAPALIVEAPMRSGMCLRSLGRPRTPQCSCN